VNNARTKKRAGGRYVKVKTDGNGCPVP
jgi:hypothetical protein